MENYLLVPSALARLVRKIGRGKRNIPSEEEIRAKVDEIATALKESVIGGRADEIGKEQTKLQASTAYARAREQVDVLWSSFDDRTSIIGGKSALADFNRWLRDTYKLSFSNVSLAAELSQSEIHPEIRDTLEALEFNEAFDPVFIKLKAVLKLRQCLLTLSCFSAIIRGVRAESGVGGETRKGLQPYGLGALVPFPACRGPADTETKSLVVPAAWG